MIVFVFNRFVEYQCNLTPQVLKSICDASKTGDVNALVKLSFSNVVVYFNADKIDVERTFQKVSM